MGRNVLITGIGSAGGKNATKSLAAHEEYRLFGTDGDRFSYPLYDDVFVETRLVPWASNPEYASAVLSFATEHDIDVIFPTFDEAVVALSDARDRFEKHGITVLVSTPGTIEVANDKYETYLTGRDAGVSTPETWRLDDRTISMTSRRICPSS